MEFIKSTDQKAIATYILYRIVAELEMGKKVVWFMPGGSAIPIVRDILSQLTQFDTKNLAVTLTDERYGNPGHNDENWSAIMKDLPTPKDATYLPINNGDSLEQTILSHQKSLRELLDWADHTIGFFGIGTDGHTAGILPKSPAASSTDSVCGYESEPYTRITITAPVITSLQDGFVYAMGREKHDVLDMLEVDIDPVAMPSQLLKSIPELLIFNDYKGKQL